MATFNHNPSFDQLQSFTLFQYFPSCFAQVRNNIQVGGLCFRPDSIDEDADCGLLLRQNISEWSNVVASESQESDAAEMTHGKMMEDVFGDGNLATDFAYFCFDLFLLGVAAESARKGGPGGWGAG